MQQGPHVLIVEDDPVSRALLAGYFETEGYRVTQRDAAESVLMMLDADPPVLVLLDVRLPGKDGLTLARELRARSGIGIIMVTSRRDDVDRIIGLEMGADDYVTKPFNPRELLARAKNIIWRVKHQPDEESRPAPQLRFENHTLDMGSHRLTGPQGNHIRLTEGEFRLLATLAESAGRVLTRAQLMNKLRHRDWESSDRTVDVLVARVRRKLGDDPRQPRIIATIPNSGYLFAATIQR
ncbi:MAG TPA: response regulator [Gammaproteobacteria bacterium]